jgi:lysozyme
MTASPKTPKQLDSELETDILEKLLMFEEGYDDKPYKDSLGFYTIGFGHLIPGPNTKANADRYHQRLLDLANEQGVGIDIVLISFLEHDIEEATAGAIRVFGTGYLLSPPSVRIALAQLVFQLGETKVSGYETTQALIREKKYDTLATRMSTWLMAKQTPNRVRRYQRLLRSGALRLQLVNEMVTGFTKGKE